MSVDQLAQEIINIIDEIKSQQTYKDEFLLQCEKLKEDKQTLEQFLKGKSADDYLNYYNAFVYELLNRIDNNLQRMMVEFEDIKPKQAAQTVTKVALQPKSFYIGKRTRKRYLKEIGASEEIIERLTKKKEKKIKPIPEYTVYQTSVYGKIANSIFRGVTRSITVSYPTFYRNLSHAIRMADVKILSRTYISCQLLTSLIMFFLSFLVTFGINVYAGTPLMFAIITTVFASVFVAVLTFIAFYVFPSTIVGNRSRMIKNDLPFAIIHMAAVAGSGAKPISIFRLILNSHEYKGIETEIRKIVNYVNLFGYDLSTAMKTVATTTPSRRFRDLLNGMVATTESGGSLKSYLVQMADDTMNTYRLERKKYVDTLATYSDIYTGILIAAPLLFIVTLAIINHLGGTLGGLTVNTVALIGTFGVIPFLNIVFLLFLNIVQPES